jgi:hypothetical protein
MQPRGSDPGRSGTTVTRAVTHSPRSAKPAGSRVGRVPAAAHSTNAAAIELHHSEG